MLPWVAYENILCNATLKILCNILKYIAVVNSLFIYFILQSFLQRRTQILMPGFMISYKTSIREDIMTWLGYTFCVTGTLWGKPKGHWWVSIKKDHALTWSFDVCFDVGLSNSFKIQLNCRWYDNAHNAPANPGAWASAVTMLTKNLVKFSSKFIWLWMIACQFLSTRERRSKWPRSWRFQSAMLERRSLIQQTESSRETCSSLRNTCDAISYIIENVIPLSKPCYLQHHVTVECIINVF